MGSPSNILKQYSSVIIYSIQWLQASIYISRSKQKKHLKKGEWSEIYSKLAVPRLERRQWLLSGYVGRC